MGKTKRKDLLSSHQEWVDHMYNKGYWVNRISWANIGQWRFIRKNNRILGFIGIAFWGTLLGILVSDIIKVQQFEISDLPGLVFMLLLFFVSVGLFIQRPLVVEKRSASNKTKQKKAKKQPKRRKDYR